MKNIFLIALLGVALVACSTTPDRVNELEQARALVNDVAMNPLAERAAANEIKEAQQALAQADRMLANNGDVEDVRYVAGIATLHAEIARERIAEARATDEIENSEGERNEVLLQAREREAERARSLAEARGAAAVASAQDAEFARDQAATARDQAAVARSEAEMAREEAMQARAERAEMEQALEELKAKETERGMILTLSDVLFDTGEATLKPGAETAIGRLADVLATYPDRTVLIEGHTDANGSDEFNRSLSERRASAVQTALVSRGVSPDRLRSHGLGERYPVATNDTAAGRQQNRRVDIVVSNESGDEFPEPAGDRPSSD